MNREQLQKVRDALAQTGPYRLDQYTPRLEAIAILDAALAAPEQEPVVYWDGDRSVIPADEVSYTPNWTDYYPTPLYRHPAPQSAQPMQWIDVSERVPDEAQIVLFVLRGKVVVGAWIAGIFWYDNAKQVATAWMPLPPPPEFGVGGYPVTAPPAAKQWVGLTNEEVVYTTFKTENEYCTPGWCMDFARAIEDALRAKNTGEQA